MFRKVLIALYILLAWILGLALVVRIALAKEGKGLRQSTRETCNQIARIATAGPIASLNVSNAAAIALHLHAGFRSGRLKAG